MVNCQSSSSLAYDANGRMQADPVRQYSYDAEGEITGIGVAEGLCGTYGASRCLSLEAPEPENPKAQSKGETVGNLWINTDDGSTINVQLSQFEGRLQELYVLFVDAKHPKRKLPRRGLRSRGKLPTYSGNLRRPFLRGGLAASGAFHRKSCQLVERTRCSASRVRGHVTLF